MFSSQPPYLVIRARVLKRSFSAPNKFLQLFNTFLPTSRLLCCSLFNSKRILKGINYAYSGISNCSEPEKIKFEARHVLLASCC